MEPPSAPDRRADSDDQRRVLGDAQRARSATPHRRQAAHLYRSCRRDPRIRIAAHAEAPDEAALKLYESRPDKAWSLTDCLSFAMMEEYGLPAPLHFEQAGYRPLLWEEPPAAV